MAGDVLDRDLVVGALGEQRIGRVEDLLAPLPGIEAADFGIVLIKANLSCWRSVKKHVSIPSTTVVGSGAVGVGSSALAR